VLSDEKPIGSWTYCSQMTHEKFGNVPSLDQERVNKALEIHLSILLKTIILLNTEY
jgi:hypothetical protein